MRALKSQFKPKRQLKNYLTHNQLLRADKLIALSQHGREVLLKLGLDPAKIEVAPNVIDPDWLEGIEPAPPIGQPQILYLGQLKYRKGFDLLARAMAPVVKEFPAARFIFAGHSPVHQSELEKIAGELGVSQNLVLPGNLSESEKAAYFLASDLYVLPTRYEGFGIPLIEAMSAGCPVISTDLPVINEIIRDGENGLLAPPEDPEGLAKVIIRLLKDKELQARLVEGGRRAVVNYYTPGLTNRLEELYQQLIQPHKNNFWRWILHLERPAR